MLSISLIKKVNFLIHILDDAAGNIFESFSRTNDQKSNQKNKASGLFG